MREFLSFSTLTTAKDAVLGPKFLDAFVPAWPNLANRFIAGVFYANWTVLVPALILGSLTGLPVTTCLGFTVITALLHTMFHLRPPGYLSVRHSGTQTTKWNGRGRGESIFALDAPHSSEYRPAYGITTTITTQLRYALALSFIGLMLRIWLGGLGIASGTSPLELFRQGFMMSADLLWAALVGALILLPVRGVLRRW